MRLYKGEQEVHQSITSETGEGSFWRTAGGCIPVGACAFGAEGRMALCCRPGQRLRRCRSGGKGLGRRLQKEGAPVWIKPLQPGFARGKQANRPSGVGNAPLLPTAPLHGKASHTILSRLRLPTNRVRLPPRRGRF